jgi:hypothetical protein
MALKQIIPLVVTLVGDGSSTVFTYALGNFYQSALGYPVAFPTNGVVPSSVAVNAPPVPVTSVAVDANGNLTLTLTSALGNNVVASFEIDLYYNSGAASSSSPTQTANVNITNTAVPISGTITVGSISGTVAVTQSAGPWTINETQLNGVALGSPSNYGTSPGAVSVQGVNAFITNTVPVTLTSTTITGTVAVTQSTSPWVVSNGGTFAVQATQTTSPWVVGGPAASGTATSGNPVLQGGVFNTTQPTVTTGQVVDLQATARGALIVASGADAINVSVASSGSTNTALATWTSATALNTAVSPYTNSLLYSTVQAIFNQVGTFSGGIVNFEASLDNTNWIAIYGSNEAGTTQANLTLTSSTVSQFVFSAVGFPYFRFRLSQVINGTGTLTIQSSISTSINVSAVSVSGNVGINYMPGTGLDNTAVPGSTLWVGGMYNSTQETYSNGDMASFQMDLHGNLYTDTNYWSGVALGDPSNFGTTPGAVTVQGVNASLFVGTTVATAAAAGILKVGVSGATGATFDAVIGASTAAANMIQVGGVFNTTQPTLTTGQSAALQVDNRGNLLVNTLAGSLVGSAVGTNAMQTGINVAGTLRIWTGVNPSGTVYAGQSDITSVGGTTVVTAAAGVLRVGIAGNANATLDSTIGAATAPTNALATSAVYQTTVPALTAGQAAARQCDTTGSAYVNTTGRSQTYRMAVKSFTPVASASAPTFSIQGSASKTVRILRLVVTTSCLTGVATPFKSDLVLQKYSALTGGTVGSTPTGSLMDSGNAAQTAVCLQYSAVPTTATAIGGLHAAELIQMITPTASLNGITRNEFDFGDKNGQGLVLRGTAQYLGITINPLGTTPLMSLWIEWVEDNS